MRFYISLIFWILLAAFLVLGIVMATKGSFLLLGIGLVAFTAGFIKYGCLTH